jgi:hypothetical protein
VLHVVVIVHRLRTVVSSTGEGQYQGRHPSHVDHLLPANDAAKLIKMLKAILTDVQFWIPVGVLAVGVAMLAWLH